ncbi:MAG: hypothetical protein H6Q19_110 [Bacteroidetes bacterium]|nr:hypothetical protein [Bacteroidota bacterium]
MKKIFSKKRLVIIFTIAVIVSIPIVIFADELKFYRSDALTGNGKMEVISKIGSSTIVNRSDKDYLVPRLLIVRIKIILFRIIQHRNMMPGQKRHRIMLVCQFVENLNGVKHI